MTRKLRRVKGKEGALDARAALSFCYRPGRSPGWWVPARLLYVQLLHRLDRRARVTSSNGVSR